MSPVVSSTLTRTFRFVAFTLTEYTRSGRIMIELIITAAVFFIFFLRPMEADYFFSTAGLLVLILTLYTTSAIMSLGDRPQSHLVLMRRLGRGGFILGLYLTALLIEVAVFGLLSLLVAMLNPITGLGLGGWMLGMVPLVLNLALVSALMTLLAPMVLSSGWRLGILALIAVAFSGNLVSGQMLASLQELQRPLLEVINILRTISSTPLLPLFTGYSLSVTRDYSGVSIAIPFAQLSLTLSLLALSLYAFSRRELAFSSG